MRTRHDGDCTIYASLSNYSLVEAGICTCGYGHEKRRRDGNDDEMYSKELEEKIARAGQDDTD